MQVRMLRSVAGPVGSFGANRVVELPDEVAQRWITAGPVCGVGARSGRCSNAIFSCERKRAKRQGDDAQQGIVGRWQITAVRLS